MKLRNVSVNYIGVIKPDVCEKIISLGLSKIDLSKSKGLSSKARMKISNTKKNNIKIRESEVTGLNDKWIYDIIIKLMKDANKSAGWNWHIDSIENMQFAVYHGNKKDGGFFGWHIDGSSDFYNAYKPAVKISNDPPRYKLPKINAENVIILDNKGQPEADMNSEDLPLIDNDGLRLDSRFSASRTTWGKVRKISMTINLSDPKKYEGGNLKLDLGLNESEAREAGKERFKVCNDIKPQGSAIFFPSFSYHCITPVTSGTRYSLAAWFLGKPWQ